MLRRMNDSSTIVKRLPRIATIRRFTALQPRRPARRRLVSLPWPPASGLAMYDGEKLKRLSRQREKRSPDGERPVPFVTASGRPVRRVYDPTDGAELGYGPDR